MNARERLLRVGAITLYPFALYAIYVLFEGPLLGIVLLCGGVGLSFWLVYLLFALDFGWDLPLPKSKKVRAWLKKGGKK